MNIYEMAREAGFAERDSMFRVVFVANKYDLEKFAALVAAQEREAIAQMFKDAPALVQFAQNDQGGCFVCGFTPKLVIELIRARGTT